MMVHRARVLFMILVLAGIGLGQTPESSAVQKERREAERLWEQVIEAKGGRERLQQINSLLITIGKLPKAQIRLFAFPDRYWEWEKGRIVHDYYLLGMGNMERGVHYRTSDTTPTRVEENLTESDRADYRESWLISTFPYLLESRWHHPKPIRTFREMVGNERLDVVVTTLQDLTVYKDRRMDVYVDPESLVVRGVAVFSGTGVMRDYYAFGSHIAVDGIQMPSTFAVSSSPVPAHGSGGPAVSFRFNVDYDPNIFTIIPSIAMGPDSWQKK